jgi:hypothetical protein
MISLLEETISVSVYRTKKAHTNPSRIVEVPFQFRTALWEINTL